MLGNYLVDIEIVALEEQVQEILIVQVVFQIRKKISEVDIF